MGGVGTGQQAFSYTSYMPDALGSIPLTALVIEMQLIINVIS